VLGSVSTIRPCRDDDRATILVIVNAAAEAYRSVIPADRWHDPYMPLEELDKSNRKQPFSFNNRVYKLRWRIENAFNRLKDFRRIATRYDKLARNYLASICLAAALVWWI
jgi:transposase